MAVSVGVKQTHTVFSCALNSCVSKSPVRHGIQTVLGAVVRVGTTTSMANVNPADTMSRNAHRTLLLNSRGVCRRQSGEFSVFVRDAKSGHLHSQKKLNLWKDLAKQRKEPQTGRDGYRLRFLWRT